MYCLEEQIGEDNIVFNSFVRESSLLLFSVAQTKQIFFKGPLTWSLKWKAF